MIKLILLFLIVISNQAIGQNLDGDYDLVIEYGKPLLISEDTTWSGDIFIADMVDVDYGAKLTIKPGTTITADTQRSWVGIHVYGKLEAVRSITDDPIIFLDIRVEPRYAAYDMQGNGWERPLTSVVPHPHPELVFNGVEYYGLLPHTAIFGLAGIARVQNSFFYQVQIYSGVGDNFENNTLINSEISISTFDRAGHYHDFLNNDIVFDESNSWPIQIGDNFGLRFEGNNIAGAYQEEEPFRYVRYTKREEEDEILDLSSNYINFENYVNREDFFWDSKDSVEGGTIKRDSLRAAPNSEAGWGQEPSLDLSEFQNGSGNITEEPEPGYSSPVPIALPGPESLVEINEISIVVTPFVISDLPVYVAGLKETKSYSEGVLVSHTLEYGGEVYVYDEVSQYFAVVERNDLFTESFKAEMLNVISLLTPADLAAVIDFSYSEAVIFIAGFDGSYID